MNRLVKDHTKVISLDGGRSKQTDVPMTSAQGRVEALVGAPSPQDNVVAFMPKEKPIVAASEAVNGSGEIDYLKASLGYRPSNMPAGSSKIDDVHEVKSLLDSMNKVFLCLLRGSGGDNYAMYKRAIEIGEILIKDYNHKLNSYLFGRNWFLVDGELWNTNENVSDKIYKEGGRIVSIIATRLGIQLKLTREQEENARSSTPVYQKEKKFKKAA